MIRKESERIKLRKKLGRLHLEVLQKERGNKCEICGMPAKDLARFHILTVGAHPRLEFSDVNILLYARVHWYTCHEPYHHDRDSKKGKFIMQRIKELRGEDYIDKILMTERCMPKHSEVFLRELLNVLLERLQNTIIPMF